MLNVLIVDDEKYIRDELNYILGKLDNCIVKAETGDADEVLDLIQEFSIDVVFLDIELRHENGLRVGRRINDLEKPPSIILSTAYDKYAMSGYELNVIDYILKPFNDARVERAVKKAEVYRGNNNEKSSGVGTNKLAVTDKDRTYILPIEEAIYFEAFGNNAIVYTAEKAYTLSSSLKKIEEKLKGHNFKRISKSHIVNVDMIVEIIPWFNYKCKLTLKNIEEELIVTRSYYKEFKETILIN